MLETPGIFFCPNARSGHSQPKKLTRLRQGEQGYSTSAVRSPLAIGIYFQPFPHMGYLFPHKRNLLNAPTGRKKRYSADMGKHAGGKTLGRGGEAGSGREPLTPTPVQRLVSGQCWACSVLLATRWAHGCVGSPISYFFRRVCAVDKVLHRLRVSRSIFHLHLFLLLHLLACVLLWLVVLQIGFGMCCLGLWPGT